MFVRIDPDLCCGHAICVDVAPEVFQMKDDGKAHVLIDHPGPELFDKVESAVRVCPQMAIDCLEES